jgi:predicted AAA+ superfamily ATPase
MRKADLERYNEWWFTGKIRKELSPKFKRYSLQRLIESLKERQILVITGLRRVGKTTLFYQTIEKLLDIVEPKKILYFSFDEFSANPKDVLEIYEKEVLSKPFEESGRVFVFFDEVQYAENWYSVIKQFYDLYPNIKFFISGSSSLLLSKGVLEKLAGRFFFFELCPLTFFEFLEMKGVRINDEELFSRRIEAYFFDYLKRAGFPEVVDLKEEKIGEYIKSSVIDRVIFRDIPMMFKTREMVLIEKLIKFILSNPGVIINTNSLARDLNTTRITVSNYLKLLETSLLLKELSNFRPSFLSSSRKLKKYYPATTSLVYSIFRETFERNFGKILETYAVNALDAKFYFRGNGKEIDIILQKNENIIPVEVKEKFSEDDIKKLFKLSQKFKFQKAVILSIGEKLEKDNLLVYPLYLTEKLKGYLHISQ